jgi:hypothetical protein
MLTVTNHLAAFWTVVVMNCIHPVNWQSCLPVHEWLIPDIGQGLQIYFDKKLDFLYRNERDYLDSAVK